MLLRDIIEDYHDHIKVEVGLTPRTCECYRVWLRHYSRWLTHNGQEAPMLEDFNVANLRKFLYYLVSTKHRPRTIRAAFFPLRGLGKYLVEQGALEDNPALVIKLPKLDAAQRDLVTDDEVRALLAACERQASPRRVALSRAMVSVLVYAGLRRQECLDLRVGDANFAEKSLLVRQGKGQKARTVYPHPECLLAIRDWLALRPRNCKHDWLFALDTNRRIAHGGLTHMLRELKAIAGLADHDNIQPHSLRHNCATRLLKAGADMRSIQAFLGHSLLTTTSIYLHTDEHQLRKISSLGGLEPKPNVVEPEKHDALQVAGRREKREGRFTRRNRRTMHS